MAATPGGTGPAEAQRFSLTVAAVARRLGVAPSTLRTWDRRYRLGPSAHVAGSHRRYSAADVSRLSLMRQLTLEGIPPSAAARMAREMRVHPPADAPPAGSLAEAPAAGGLADAPPAGGGRVVALPDGTPRARGLARAAMALDSGAISHLLQDALARFGVQDTWTAMAMPVLRAIGERWAATGEGVDVEHIFSEALIGALRAVSASGAARNAAPVLVGCAEGEQHSLPAHVLSAALTEQRVGCRMLGPGMPAVALASAVRRIGPCVVFLYAQLPAADAAVLAEIPRQRPAPRIVVGGPGWERLSLPPATQRVHSLSEAVEEVLLAVTP